MPLLRPLRWIALAASLTACGGEGGAGPDAGSHDSASADAIVIDAPVDRLTCEEADLEATMTLAREWSDPNVCTADTDCVLVDRTLRCEESMSMIGFCPFTIHGDSRDQFDALNASINESICPRIVEPCVSGPLCPATEPRCTAFECRGIDSPECLENCDTLGCGECAERCIAYGTCVASATTCDAVAACEPSFPYSRLVWAQPYDPTAGCLRPRVVVGVLDEPLTGSSGDATCGVGPDGRAYPGLTGTQRTAVGFPPCDAELGSAAAAAADCP